MRAEATSRERYLLLALVALGALLRFGYLLERQAAPDFARPEIDAGFHDDWARCIAFGEDRSGEWREPHEADPGLSEGLYLRPPGYPFLLAIVYRLSGGSPMAAVVVQMILGLSSIVLTWCVARRLGVAAAGIAAAVMATHWALVFFEGELHAPPLLIALQLGMVLALLSARDGGKGAPLLAGILLGLGALTRPNVLAELLVILPWLAWTRRRRALASGAPCILFAAGSMLAIAPITVRNVMVTGELVPITSNLGINLWLGNHEGADGRITDDLGSLGRFKTCYDWPQVVENLEREVGRELSDSEVSAWFRGEAVDWITSHPGEFLSLSARKAALFWGPAELGHNKDVSAEKRNSAVLKLLPFPFPLLAFVAFLGVGLHLAARRGAETGKGQDGDEVVLLVLALAVVFFLSVLPFFAAARYRVPILPWLAVLAGLVPGWRGAASGARTIALGVALTLVAVPWFASPVQQESGEKYHLDRGRAYYNQVTADTAPGRRDELFELAARELERALELGGGSASAEFELGVLEQRRGNLEAARQRYEACLRRNTGHYLARFNLGFVLEAQQDVRAAIQSFRAAAELDPTSGAAPFHQGRLLAATGRVDGAIEALRTAVERDPEEPQFASILSRYLVGAPDASLRDLPRGLELAEALPTDGPGAAGFLETRAWALAASGRPAEALGAIDRAASLSRAAGAPARELGRLTAIRQAIEAGEPPWKFP